MTEKPLAPNGCNGDCCEAFCLEVSLHKFKRFARKGKGIAYHGNAKDIKTMAAMLIPIPPVHQNGEKYFTYTCKNFDKENRLCLIYDERPELCKRFPHGSICGHCGTRANTKPINKAWSVFLEKHPNHTVNCR